MPTTPRPIPTLTDKNKRNFFRKISTTPNERGCLEWTGSKNNDGYGRFGISGSLFQAHRVAHFIATGIDPGEQRVLHKCDTPACVNSAHFFLGTDLDNARDKESKGRGNRPCGDKNGKYTKPERTPRGTNHGNAKLNDDAIRIIRDRHAAGESHKAIAMTFGMARTAISAIIRRELWKHVI